MKAIAITLLFLLAGTFAGAVLYPARVEEETETVLATYRVKPGNEDEMQRVLAEQWPALRRLHLVLDEPHLLLRGEEEGGKTYFVEIFTWKNHTAPDHAPAEIRTIWNKMQRLVEARDGHHGIEFPEVHVVIPPPGK